MLYESTDCADVEFLLCAGDDTDSDSDSDGGGGGGADRADRRADRPPPVRILAHRSILAARSPFFRAKFSRRAHEPMVTERYNGESPAVFEALVSYLYADTLGGRYVRAIEEGGAEAITEVLQ